MAILWGIILGNALGRIGFFRAIATLLFWSGVTAAAYQLALANIGAMAAVPAAVVVPAALLVWAMSSPVTSRLRYWIVESLYVTARLAMWFALFVLAWLLVESDFSIAKWLSAWPVMLVAGVTWGVQRGIIEWLAHAHDRAGDRSVAHG